MRGRASKNVNRDVISALGHVLVFALPVCKAWCHPLFASVSCCMFYYILFLLPFYHIHLVDFNDPRSLSGPIASDPHSLILNACSAERIAVGVLCSVLRLVRRFPMSCPLQDHRL